MLDTAITAVDLIHPAQLHESLIDEAALVGAFPDANLFREPQERKFVPVGTCRNASLPLFLIFCNCRLALRDSVKAIKGLATSTRIVIHKKGSHHAATLSTLEDLQTNGAIVHRSGKIRARHEVDRENERIVGFSLIGRSRSAISSATARSTCRSPILRHWMSMTDYSIASTR